MDDVKGIPDVAGLDAFVQANVEQPKSEPKPEPKAQPDVKDNFDLGQFKNPKDLLKSYKEIQGYTTKVAQENKALQEQLAQMQEQMRLMNMGNQPQVQPQPQDFDTQFINNPRNAIRSEAMQALREATVQEVLIEEQTKNPNEFNERYAFAMQARQMYPHLVNSGAGVRALFQVGDKMRGEALKRNAEKSVKMLFGEDVDFVKFKELIKKDQQPENNQGKDLAYMPDSTGAFRTGAESGQGNFDKSIDDAVGKGDVDTVLESIFKKQGLKR